MGENVQTAAFYLFGCHHRCVQYCTITLAVPNFRLLPPCPQSGRLGRRLRAACYYSVCEVYVPRCRCTTARAFCVTSLIAVASLIVVISRVASARASIILCGVVVVVFRSPFGPLHSALLWCILHISFVSQSENRVCDATTSRLTEPPVICSESAYAIQSSSAYRVGLRIPFYVIRYSLNKY